MLQVTPRVRIFVYHQSVDFRKGIDGLSAICRNMLDQDPYEGALFVFRNQTRSAIRFLIYDGQGFWLCTKRLSKGKFHWWPENGLMDARHIYTLIWNGNPDLAKFSDDWRKISVQ